MNQRKLILTLLCFVLITSSLSAQNAVKKYLKKYDSIALAKAEKYRIPVSIILGVSIEESAAGQSIICKSLNNFFGIKGKNWSSKKKMGYKSAYKEYASDAESFEHFCQVLIKKKFYSKLKGKSDYKEWLYQMNKSSYATAKQTWIDHITRTIQKYELYKFDKAEKDPTESTVVAK